MMPRIITPLSSSLTTGWQLSPTGGGPTSPTERAKIWSDRGLLRSSPSPNLLHEELGIDNKKDEANGIDDSKLSTQQSESSFNGGSRSRPGPKIRYLKDNRMQIMNRIFVGGLQKPIDENDLRDLFGEYGDIQEVQIKERGNEKVRGFAFVTYKNIEDAEEAIRQGEGEALSLHDVKLNVQRAYRKSLQLPQNKLGGVPGLSMPANFPGFPFGFGGTGAPPSSSANSMNGHPVVPFFPPYGYGYPATVPYYPPPCFSQPYTVPDMGMQNRWPPMYPMPNMWQQYGMSNRSSAPMVNVHSPPPSHTNGPPGSPSDTWLSM